MAPIGRVMPREGKFFELFDQHAAQIAVGSVELVGLMNGEIGYVTEPGRGSCFWVEFELGQVRTMDWPRTLSGRSALLAVGDSRLRDALAEQLAYLGCRHELAYDAQAVEAALAAEGGSAIGAAARIHPNAPCASVRPPVCRRSRMASSCAR